MIILIFSRPPGGIQNDDDTADDDTDKNRPYSYSSWGNRNTDDDDMDYYSSSKRPESGLVGLKNQGATCYLNSLIQTMFLTPEFRRMIYSYPCNYAALLEEASKETNTTTTTASPSTPSNDPGNTKNTSPKKDIIYQMQLLFARMQYSNLSSVSTSGLTTSFGWDNSETFVQHDVQELNRVLCDKLEEKMKGKLQEKDFSIDKLYRGVMMNMIKCTFCNRISFREEDFYDVSLTIKGKKNILESLEEFTEVETLKDDNAYFCEKCNKLQTAEKSIKFRYLPAILNIQLKRFEYDWNNDVRVKLNDEIAFPGTLDASNYIVDMSTIPDAKVTSAVTYPPQYELYAILVHSGSAGFGHYYAFIRNFTDGKWYKFNDEHVTPVDEKDIESHNWLNSTSTSSTSSWLHSMQRSATPYMLVYRNKYFNVAPPTPSSTPTATAMDIDNNITTTTTATTSEAPVDNDFIYPAIENSDIPAPILNKLEKEQQVREEKRVQRERELNTCTITVHRNKVDLPVKRIKCDRNITLQQLYDEILKEVTLENNKDSSTMTPLYYRLRRIASRKNQTKRPMQYYKTTDYDKTLIDLGIDKRQHIYLEQFVTEEETLKDDFDDSQTFLTVRIYSQTQRKPISLGDEIIPKSITLLQFKQYIIDKYFPQSDMKAEALIAVEEETDKIINPLLDNNMPMSKYGIVSGDIVHLEELVPDYHFAKGNNTNKLSSFTEAYYIERRNEVVVDITESTKSFKRRNPKDATSSSSSSSVNSNNILQVEGILDEWKDKPISLKISVHKNEEFSIFKEILNIKTGISPSQMRVYCKSAYDNTEGRLLKDSTAPLGQLLTKYSRITTDLLLEILDHDEELRKGDRLIPIRYYNNKNDLVSILEIKINKSETFFDLKTKLKERTGISEELQVLSEWYNEHFYKLFLNDSETIASARIRKSDILRMDVVKDKLFNLNDPTNPVLALQLVKYVEWGHVAHTSRKEMQTTMPELLTIPLSYSLFELRQLVAERCGIPAHNLNLAFAQGFPIVEGGINPLRDEVKKNIDQVNYLVSTTY